MKIKPLVLAAALALPFAGAYAANFVIPLVGPSAVDGYSASYGNSLSTAGTFTDTFTFTPSMNGFVNGSLVTASFNSSNNIDFVSASINGIAFVFSPTGANEFGFAAPAYTSGPLVLTVTGIAGPMASGTIAASYAGTFNIAAVPEPETYAMMLAGLGLFGFVSRRKKKQRPSEATFA